MDTCLQDPLPLTSHHSIVPIGYPSRNFIVGQWFYDLQACRGEERNMVKMPKWERGDLNDTCLPQLVNVLLRMQALESMSSPGEECYLQEHVDVRDWSESISTSIAEPPLWPLSLNDL